MFLKMVWSKYRGVDDLYSILEDPMNITHISWSTNSTAIGASNHDRHSLALPSCFNDYLVAWQLQRRKSLQNSNNSISCLYHCKVHYDILATQSRLLSGNVEIHTPKADSWSAIERQVAPVLGNFISIEPHILIPSFRSEVFCIVSVQVFSPVKRISTVC